MKGERLSRKPGKKGERLSRKPGTKDERPGRKSGAESGRPPAAFGRQKWRPGNMLYPVPAVMVSVAGPEGTSNIITVAWAGTVCSDPPMVSISVRPERYSYQLLKDSGEFVINLTTRSLAWAADYCGVRSGRDVDKWREAALTPVPAFQVSAPLIGESPVNLECRVTQVIELGSHHMFLAKVESVDVDPSYLDEKGTLHLERADLVAYSHGRYLALGEELGSFGYSVRKDQKKAKTGAKGVYSSRRNRR